MQREVYESLVEELERVMNELLERAWREPGHLHEERVEIGHLGVAITVLDYAEYRIAIFPALDDSNRPVPLDILELLVRVIFGKSAGLPISSRRILRCSPPWDIELAHRTSPWRNFAGPAARLRQQRSADQMLDGFARRP